jgi:hypothetical protein
MLSTLLVASSLALGQAEPLPVEPAAEAEAAFENRPLLQELLHRGRSDDAAEPFFKITGWTEGSFTASTASGDQLPMGFNYEANDFVVQQNWLRLDRAVDPAASEPTFGFRSDTILPGTDYRFTIARGLWDQQLMANNDAPALYGIDPVQFYAEAYFPDVGRGLSVKAGRFFSPYGVESIDTTATPFASRAYTFIYNPFTHTGVLTTLNVTESVTVTNGIVTGSDIFIDPAANPTYFGSIKWAPPDAANTLQLSTILSDGRFDVQENFNHPQVFDLVWTHKIDEKWNYSLDALYGFQDNVPGAGFADWFGVVNYLTRTWTPNISSTARLEFFYDAEGNRTGSEGLYTAITGGVNVRPMCNLTVRPEVRYDHNSESDPFSGDSNLITATLDFIIHW